MIKRYRVLGPSRYRDHDVGEIFPAALTPDEEQRALDRGNIEIVGEEPTVAERRSLAAEATSIREPRVGLGGREKASYAHGGGK
jgi:hypothetical protein